MTNKRTTVVCSTASQQHASSSSANHRQQRLASIRPRQIDIANLRQSIPRHIDNLQILALRRPRTALWLLWLTDYLARKQLVQAVPTALASSVWMLL